MKALKNKDGFSRIISTHCDAAQNSWHSFVSLASKRRKKNLGTKSLLSGCRVSRPFNLHPDFSRVPPRPDFSRVLSEIFLG